MTIIFLKVPGRMGMILLLYLISTNVYNSIEAPSQRGFSYIEVWQIGVQFPILVAICEYGFVLFLKKGGFKSATCDDETLQSFGVNVNLDNKIRKLDYITMIFNFVFLMLFVTLYWCILSYK